MDVIGSGDFAVSTENGNTVMSFRTPASKCIDFVEEFKADSFREQQKAFINRSRGPSPRRAQSKTGRGKGKGKN